MTFQATYETGWHATVKDDDRQHAQMRFAQMGRGERFEMRRVEDAKHQVWGRDEDDDYTDDEQ
jgi:hypothetical protein